LEIYGEKLLTVPRLDVWRALNDPAVLQRCLAGCDTFEEDGENTNNYRVAMRAAVGPVRARFAGKLQLSDIVAPTSYALSFEGSGGVAGFGKGTAQVVLEDAGEGTRLSYVAKAQVGGRLAQVGARLIDGVTKRMADDFFSRFVNELTTSSPVSEDGQRQLKNATTDASAVTIATPLQAPLQSPSQSSTQSTQIAVIAAAVSATAAAVAVLAAVFAVYFAR
jgi:uncharacterized protein